MSTITLPNIRVSSDLTVSVRLKDNGVAIDWSTLNNVKASIYSDAQRALAGRCDVSVDAEDPTVLVCQYAANKPQYVGVCRIVVSAKYMGETKTYDKPAFNFVRWTADQDGEQITIDDPDVDVEIEVSDVSSSLLDEAIRAAFTAAEEAVDAKGQVLETEAEVEAAEALRVSAEESRVEAEEGRAEAEAARVDEEAVRVSAEDARVVAENARAAAEDLREGAEDDRAAAETARETAEAARVAAEALRVTAESSRETAEAAREAQASADHTVAAGDHTQAAADHTQAAADHTTAASDHTQAGADHTLAAADHVTAGEDHAQAQDDHEVMAGYDTRLGNVEGEVSQLEAKVDDNTDEIDTLKETAPKTRTTEENGLYVCDKDGKVLIRLDVLDTKGGFGPNLVNEIISIVQANAVALSDVMETGFYICNENGQVIIKYENGRWVLYDNKKAGFYRRTGNLANNDVWVLSSNSVKNEKRLVFSGTISSFSSLTLGHGHGTDYASYGLSAAQWNASRVVIDSTKITVYNWNGSETSNEYTHGLTIENEIQVEIVKGHSSTATIRIVSNGNAFSQDVTWQGSQGDIFLKSGSSLTDCSFSWYCNLLKGGTWLFGDSFFSLTATDRWTSHLFADGFNGNLIAGYSGGKSGVSLDYVKNLLTIATPETIVWCLGMNNGDDGAVNPEWMSAYNELKSICADENITLILATIPNAESTESTEGGSATTVYHDYKNAIVRSSGYRYIDFATAVGADENGEWYSGMKNATNVHPTTTGATALYQRAICDAPELMK